MTDDPYGTNLARPGDRFVPLIGSEDDPKSEAVFSFDQPAGRPTRVQVEQAAGLAMDYLKYDDREIYLLRSAAVSRNWPIGTFSPRTLCLHNLRLGGLRPGAIPPPAAVRVPLYWYPTNVQTRGHCANEAVQLAISPDIWSGGPIRLAVQSTTPNRTIESRVKAELNVAPDSLGGRAGLLLGVSSRLEVLTQFDMPEIQFLNLFPYDSWRTEDWECDWVISLDEAGRAMTYLIKEPYDKRKYGDQANAWSRTFFLAQGPRDRGNLFLLARPAASAKRTQKQRHVLCRVWLDSHLGVHGLPTPVPAGTKLAVEYTVAIAGDRRLSMAEAFEIGRAALKSGRLGV
jgi:hypothetical protein